ncbi:MAG: hypothetical protein MI975_15025 [Cytophagales bacterium]|nr:hypothetical protein [Cytophagales bacterium]
MLKKYRPVLIRENERRRFSIFLLGALITIYISIYSELFQALYGIGNDCSRRFNIIIRSMKVYSFWGFEGFDPASNPVRFPAEPEKITNHIGMLTGQPFEYERKGAPRAPGQSPDTMHLYREYEDICLLVLDIWSAYPKNEVMGFIADNGNLIITSVGDTWRVSGPKPILFNDRYYLAWPKHAKLKSTYQGAIRYSGSDFIFLPVKAMFHTHVLSGALSPEDRLIAKRFDKIRHILIERTRISEFDGRGIKKVYNGNMLNLCELVHN